MKEGFIHSVMRRPILILMLSLLVVSGIGYGASNLYFRGDYKVFFGDDNPQLQGFETMQKIFNKNDNVAIIVAPKNGNVFTKKNLELIYKISEDAWQTPYSTRVDSLTNYQNTVAEEDDLIVEDLVLDLESLDANKIASIKQVSTNEPMLRNRIVSPSGHVSQISVTVQLPTLDPNSKTQDQTKEIFDISQSVRALVEKYKALYPEVDFHLAGIIMMNNSFAEEATNDAATLIPGMLLIILIMLAILLRSFMGMLATLVIIITSIIATLGGTGWLGFYISTPTVNVPVLVMTLAVADCVHIIASMNYNLRQGMEKFSAIENALEINLMPIFITSATTSIGFLTFNFSDVPPFRDLGNMVAWGVMMAFILSITLLPALLLLLPIKPPKNTQQDGRMEKFAEWVIAKRKVLLPTTSLFIIGMTALVPINQVNDVAVEYFTEDVAFRQASDFADEQLMGGSSIDFALDSGKANGINAPEFLQTVEDFSTWARQQEIVDHVYTLSDTFKRLNKNMHGDDEAQYKLPTDNELAAQYLLLYEMSLPYGLDLNNQINIDKSILRITVSMDNVGSTEILAIEKEARAWFATNAPTLKVTAASPALMFGHIGDRNMSSMLIGTSVAMILISVLLVFALRSVKLGIVSLLPNLAPAGVGFGFWALYSGDINLGLSIVTSMCLGIVVDDTVHFLAKYKRARMLGKNAEDAVRYAFASVGRALWITTIVLFSGFMVLAQSAFALNGNMGLLTALIIVIALAIDFLFLPVFLILIDKKPYITTENGEATNDTLTQNAKSSLA